MFWRYVSLHTIDTTFLHTGQVAKYNMKKQIDAFLVVYLRSLRHTLNRQRRDPTEVSLKQFPA